MEWRLIQNNHEPFTLAWPIYITFRDGSQIEVMNSEVNPGLRLACAVAGLMLPIDQVSIAATVGTTGVIHYYRRDGGMFGTQAEVARA